MDHRELRKQVQDLTVEKYQSGEDYKKRNTERKEKKEKKRKGTG